MSFIWPALLFGFAFVAFMELVGPITREPSDTAHEMPNAFVPTTAERAQYWTVCIAFAATPVIAVWIAAGITRVRIWGVGYLVLAGLWFFVGILTVILPLIRGRAALNAFISSVEHQSRASFKLLVRLWIGAIVFLVLCSIRRFTV